MSNTQQRSGHWDWWKGIAIIAVISIHALGATATSNGPFSREFALVFRPVVNFSVALFLCMAGYFAAKSWRGDAIGYWRSRGLRILPPYLFWTTLAILLTKPRHFASPGDLAGDYFLGLGIEIGYYVIVLLQYVVLVPLLARLSGPVHNISAMVIAMAIGLAISYTLQISLGDSKLSRFPYNCLAFIVWAPFFQLGFWAGRNPDAIKARSDNLWLWLAGLAVLAAIAEAFYWESRGLARWAESQLRASSFGVSLCVALHVISTRRATATGPIAAGLEWLGRCSFMVYLAHMIFLPKVTAVIRLLLPDLYSVRPLAVLLATALTATVCIGIAIFVQKLTRPAIHRDLLGAG
jgi:fucose 4-O-acetylase-like acetyltransferase